MAIKKKIDQSKLNKEAKQQRKSLITFLGVVSTLVAIGVYHHLNSDQSNKSTEAFYESRKSPGAYYEYQESEESSKKKAERNIFLQD
jgi:predicted secreted protein